MYSSRSFCLTPLMLTSLLVLSLPLHSLLFLTGKEEIDTACVAYDTPVLCYRNGGGVPIVVPLCEVDPTCDALVSPDHSPAPIVAFQRRNDKEMVRIMQSCGEAYTVTKDHTLTLCMSGFPPVCTRHNTRGEKDNLPYILLTWLSPDGGDGVPTLRETRFMIDKTASRSDTYYFDHATAKTAMYAFANSLPRRHQRTCRATFDQKSGVGLVQAVDSNGNKLVRRFPVFSSGGHNWNTYCSFEDAQADAEAVLHAEGRARRVLRDGDLIDLNVDAFSRIPANIAKYFFGVKSFPAAAAASDMQHKYLNLSSLAVEPAARVDHIKMQVVGSGAGRYLLGDGTITHNCEILFDRMNSLGKGAPPLLVLPVYSALPSELQTKIFEPAPPGSRVSGEKHCENRDGLYEGRC